MNKHTRLVVSLLFVFIIVLSAAITRFYFSSPEGTVSKNTTAEIARVIGSDEDGNRIFDDGSGNCGLIDSGDRLIVYPEWMELQFAGKGKCIAAKHIGSRTLYGCIDYEGNIVIPLIYRGITKRGNDDFSYYTAVSYSDDSVVVYDSSFAPLFRRSWDSCVAGENELVLTTGMGIYTYSVGEHGLLMKSASVTGEAMGCSYNFDVSSRVLFEKLDANMLEKITSSVGKYLEYAYSGDIEKLSDVTNASYSSFNMLFPDDHMILSKRLLGIPEIYIYSAKSENSQPNYEVSILTDTELTYSDSKGETKTMRDEYRAVMRFSGSSESNITAVSGSFMQTEPDYPPPEPPEEKDDSGEKPDDAEKPKDTVKADNSYDGSVSGNKIQPTTTDAPH